MEQHRARGGHAGALMFQVRECARQSSLQKSVILVICCPLTLFNETETNTKLNFLLQPLILHQKLYPTACLRLSPVSDSAVPK